MLKWFNKDYYEDNGVFIDKETGLLLHYPVDEAKEIYDREKTYTETLHIENSVWLDFPLRIVNYSNNLKYFKIVLQSIPVGLKYSNHRTPRGQYYQEYLTWQVGKIEPHETIRGELIFEVLDQIFSPFVFKYNIKYAYG